MSIMGSEHFDNSKGSMEDDHERSVFGDIQQWKPRKINTSCEKEKHVPQITGCCVMPDLKGTVVICDNANSKVKVLNNDRNEIKIDIEVTGGPFDIDSVDQNSAVLSIPKSNALQFLCIHPGLRLEKSIRMNRECYGVAVRNKNIYVCIPDAGIQIVSQDGDMLKLVNCQTNRPRYVCVNAYSSRIYYSCNAGSVRCVTSSEHNVFKHDSAKLQKPGSLVADGMNTLLVCNNAAQEIHKLNQEGTLDKIISLSGGSRGAGNYTSMCSNKSCEILILATATGLRSELLLYEPNRDASSNSVTGAFLGSAIPSKSVTGALFGSAILLCAIYGLGLKILNRK